MTAEPDALTRCFAAAFPELPLDEIPQASVDTVPEWDSLAALTLVALIEEEFGLAIPDAAFPELSSFVAVRDYLRSEHHLP